MKKPLPESVEVSYICTSLIFVCNTRLAKMKDRSQPCVGFFMPKPHAGSCCGSIVDKMWTTPPDHQSGKNPIFVAERRLRTTTGTNGTWNTQLF